PRAPVAFVDRCRQRGLDTLLDAPVAVIGDGTAAAARATGLEPALVGPGTGIGLAADLNAALNQPSTLLFPCGEHRRSELPDALQAAGHDVVPVVVYRMAKTPIEQLPTIHRAPAAVVVTSPRSARLYLEAIGGRPLPCPHWALGPTTRDAADALGVACSIPAEPTLESLAEDLCRN
ncbi:MAG: uroporphyrinogen-III synthase, partial [Holophagae bacterium]